MIDATQFWKSWLPEYRYTWYITAVVFSLSVGFYWISHYRGNDAIIHWEKIQEQKAIESTLHSFSVGPFELSVPGDNYVILEYFNGSNIAPNTTASDLYIAILAIGALILLTIITTLDRFWFILGTVLFMLFVASLRFKVLELFGQYNHIPLIVVLVIYGALATYFNMIKPGIDLTRRLLVFSLPTALLGVVIFYFSNVKYPLLHLSVTAYPAALILTILFILLVSHEIIASFIAILSRSGSGAGRVRHFLILCLIYMANLLLTALHELGTLDWNFVYVNLYLLLTVSAILGIWGFRDRQHTYENIMPFSPSGALFYLALGSIAFATIGGLFGNVNDAALKVIGDTIIYSHLGFSFIFIFYILSNFASLLGQDMAVHKVLYKPNRMPYFTFQFAGLIVTLAFVFYSGWRVYVYNGVAGFYTALGDLDIKLENAVLARAHFDRAHSYGFQNHHANYAMAKLTLNRYNFGESQRYLALANGKRPSEFSLINSGNLYLWQNNYFDAIANFRSSQSRMKDSGILANNLGYAYGKVHNLDSALYFLNQARNDEFSRPTAETNFLALSAMEYLPVNSDTTFSLFDSRYTATLANALALANIQQQQFDAEVDPFASRKLNLYSATLLNNYLIKNIRSLDSVSLAKAYALADDTLNASYLEALKVPIAAAYYYQTNVSRALEIMAELVYISSTYQGNYNYTMGLWALEQGDPGRAASFFDYAVMQNYKKAKLYKAIALTESGRLGEARIAWDTVLTSASEGEAEIARQISHILVTPASRAAELPDPVKYQFCRYRTNVFDTLLFDRVVATFDDNNYKAGALLDMARRQFEGNYLNKAIRYLNQLGGIELTDKDLFNRIRHFELLMLSERRELDKLASQINEGIEFDPGQDLEKLLYQALMSEANNDTATAARNYFILSTYNPYFEEGIVAAADYYRDHSKDNLRAYNILAEAVQLNDNSLKLWNAYIREAIRVGFDEYAVSALQRVEEIRLQLLRSN
jgi:Flp pilus assembly protein TadD